MEIKIIKGTSNKKRMKPKRLSVKNINKKWDKILYGKRKIGNKEAEEMHKITKKIRKESWVRNANT